MNKAARMHRPTLIEGELQPAALSSNDRLDLYARMCLARSFERMVARLVAEAKIHGFAHLSLGQEATEVGACAALERTDQIVGTHRSHGQLLAKGADPFRVMAEILGRASGYSGGRGGEMHMAIPELGVLATTGVVGAGLPLAVGAGLAAKRLGDTRLVLVFFGDGAVAQGTFHESLNLASLWRLPVIFLCVVNQFAEMSPIALHLARLGVANRADSYGCRGLVVDGNDVEGVRLTVAKAASIARAGEPVLIEAQTFLLTGHYEGADQSYRDAAAVASALERDPVTMFREKLLADGVSAELLSTREESMSRLVAEATTAALKEPLPEPSALNDEVFA